MFSVNNKYYSAPYDIKKLIPFSLIVQFSSSLCKAPYHSNVKKYTDLGQLNCGVFRPQVHLILITKKTGTREEQTSGFNHEYQ